MTEQKISEWIEQLLGQVATAVGGSVARLREAVPVAAELFGEAALRLVRPEVPPPVAGLRRLGRTQAHQPAPGDRLGFRK